MKLLEQFLAENEDKLSLAKAAAVHVRLTRSSDPDSGAERSTYSKTKSRLKAHEASIEAKHGKEALHAIRSNTNGAFGHDHTFSGHGISQHHDFVKNHLGGHGSAAHKKYVSEVRKHMPMSPEDEAMHHWSKKPE